MCNTRVCTPPSRVCPAAAPRAGGPALGAACPTCLCRPPPALFREAPCCVYTHHGLLRVEPCLPGIRMWACSPQDPSMWPRLQRRCWLMALHEVMPRGVAWAWSPGVFLQKGEIWLQTLTHRAGQVNTKAGCVWGAATARMPGGPRQRGQRPETRRPPDIREGRTPPSC